MVKSGMAIGQLAKGRTRRADSVLAGVPDTPRLAHRIIKLEHSMPTVSAISWRFCTEIADVARQNDLVPDASGREGHRR